MELDRRRFLRHVGAGAATLGLAGACASRPCPVPPAPPGSRGGIAYRADAPVAALGAHCDDLPFHCWHYLTKVRPIVAVDLFMGIPPAGTTFTDPSMGTYDVGEYMRRRHDEERAVMRAASAGEPHFLSGLDMPYRGGGVPNLGVLASELTAVVPAASRLLAPLGLGNRIRVGTPNYSHIDHKMVRDVADSFAGVPKVYYAEIYALSHRSSDYDELLDHMRAYRHWKLERVELTAAEIAAKRAALRLYASQIDGLLRDVPDILSDGVLGTELYWSPA